MPKTYVALDLETMRLDASRNAVIGIGAHASQARWRLTGRWVRLDIVLLYPGLTAARPAQVAASGQ
jgi:hypothetical protein